MAKGKSGVRVGAAVEAEKTIDAFDAGDNWAEIEMLLVEVSAGEAIRHAKEFSLTICKDMDDNTQSSCTLTDRDKSSFKLMGGVGGHGQG